MSKLPPSPTYRGSSKERISGHESEQRDQLCICRAIILPSRHLRGLGRNALNRKVVVPGM